jgi:hypothetical protein
MKTFRIEVQRIKGMSNANSWLSLSEESARTLQLLLKAQFAQIDGRKARSQR